MNEKIQKEIEELKKQAEEWRGKYLRALADYQNLQKHTREEMIQARVYAAETVILQLLPIVDDFVKLKDHVKDPAMDLVYKELYAVLEDNGIKKISVVGSAFDPHTMECIEVIDGKEGVVVEELAPGYQMRDRIVRVAKVKVGKEKTNI